MYIALVRHFKVDCNAKVFMTSDEFKSWVTKYDTSDVIQSKFDISKIKWDKCFSSELSRAIKTSEIIYNGEIIKTHLLREVPLSPICETNLKLPYVFWCISGRIAWKFQHKSQIEGKRDTQRRANEFLDILENEYSSNNILIVCHGFFMSVLQKELKRRGFVGKTIRRPQNGALYLYNK